ncbi:MAG: hypothetical protein IPP97_00240 [Candidatus Obscuribacter sp.]|nr:hypothetical protein [Candidatus Obscuribacter sp.]
MSKFKTATMLLSLSACLVLTDLACFAQTAPGSRKEMIHRSLLECYSKMGRGAEVGQEYATLIAIKPNDALLHYNYGYHLLTAGNVAGAVLHYKRATQLDPANQPYHAALGNLLMQQKNYQGALLEFGRAGEAGRGPYEQVQKYIQQLEQQRQYNTMLKQQAAPKKSGGGAAAKKSNDDDDE